MTDDVILILGASGQGREVAAAAAAKAAADASWKRVHGFLDDSAERQGKTIGGLQVIGDLSYFSRGAGRALLGVGYPETKGKVLDRVRPNVVEWPTLVHPDASIGERITLGEGCFIQAGCVLTCDIAIAEFVTVNCGVSINHDVRIGPLATLSPGVHVGGNVTIGKGVFVGIGASIKQGVTLGEWSVIGAGAAVISDVPPNAVFAGVPARGISKREPGWQNG
jgi:sugar O-acyltransferase (sialic acid O-acetyltransferase NeuD family)